MARPPPQAAAGQTTPGRRVRAWRPVAHNGHIASQLQAKPAKRWSDLFKDNRHCNGDMALSRIPKHGTRAVLSANNMEPIECAMGHCLIGWSLCYARLPIIREAHAVSVRSLPWSITLSIRIELQNTDRISFARVLVEVDITKPLPESIPVTLSDNRELDLQITFEAALKLYDAGPSELRKVQSLNVHRIREAEDLEEVEFRLTGLTGTQATTYTGTAGNGTLWNGTISEFALPDGTLQRRTRTPDPETYSSESIFSKGIGQYRALDKQKQTLQDNMSLNHTTVRAHDKTAQKINVQGVSSSHHQHAQQAQTEGHDIRNGLQRVGNNQQVMPTTKQSAVMAAIGNRNTTDITAADGNQRNEVHYSVSGGELLHRSQKGSDTQGRASRRVSAMQIQIQQQERTAVTQNSDKAIHGVITAQGHAHVDNGDQNQLRLGFKVSRREPKQVCSGLSTRKKQNLNKAFGLNHNLAQDLLQHSAMVSIFHQPSSRPGNYSKSTAELGGSDTKHLKCIVHAGVSDIDHDIQNRDHMAEPIAQEATATTQQTNCELQHTYSQCREVNQLATQPGISYLEQAEAGKQCAASEGRKGSLDSNSSQQSDSGEGSDCSSPMQGFLDTSYANSSTSEPDSAPAMEMDSQQQWTVQSRARSAKRQMLANQMHIRVMNGKEIDLVSALPASDFHQSLHAHKTEAASAMNLGSKEVGMDDRVQTRNQVARLSSDGYHGNKANRIGIAEIEEQKHIRERSLRAQEELQRLQEIGYTTGNFEEEYQLVRKCADQLSRADFLYCKQKAKCKYFREVDRNTTYFHSLVKRTNRKQEIMVIEKSDGDTTTCLNEIINEFVDTFQGLLGTSLQRIPLNTKCLDFGRTLNLEQQGMLVLMPTEEEIKKALFSIGRWQTVLRCMTGRLQIARRRTLHRVGADLTQRADGTMTVHETDMFGGWCSETAGQVVGSYSPHPCEDGCLLSGWYSESTRHVYLQMTAGSDTSSDLTGHLRTFPASGAQPQGACSRWGRGPSPSPIGRTATVGDGVGCRRSGSTPLPELTTTWSSSRWLAVPGDVKPSTSKGSLSAAGLCPNPAARRQARHDSQAHKGQQRGPFILVHSESSQIMCRSPPTSVFRSPSSAATPQPEPPAVLLGEREKREGEGQRFSWISPVHLGEGGSREHLGKSKDGCTKERDGLHSQIPRGALTLGSAVKCDPTTTSFAEAVFFSSGDSQPKPAISGATQPRKSRCSRLVDGSARREGGARWLIIIARKSQGLPHGGFQVLKEAMTGPGFTSAAFYTDQTTTGRSLCPSGCGCDLARANNPGGCRLLGGIQTRAGGGDELVVGLPHPPVLGVIARSVLLTTVVLAFPWLRSLLLQAAVGLILPSPPHRWADDPYFFRMLLRDLWREELLVAGERSPAVFLGNPCARITLVKQNRITLGKPVATQIQVSSKTLTLGGSCLRPGTKQEAAAKNPIGGKLLGQLNNNVLSELEDAVLEPPLDLKSFAFFQKKIKHLADLFGSSLIQCLRRVFIDIGLPGRMASEEWFLLEEVSFSN
ncbi:hypothetical protein ZIOFF_042342 [Zingiber officinale]|uniref:DUF7870 domain-containing protein n=1 Tax=Zingiber officinale TaxID=94328 RepID=A0A8J5G9D7_ZINOF|nr:hypothetical protein ZIOFF_042342 [Zingiber officinale]